MSGNSMKKIIITGATSMIGVALTEIAVRKKTEVYAIIREDTKRRDRIIDSPYVHVIYGSLDKLQEIEGIPTDCDVIYHFAWAGTGKESRNNPDVQEKNIRYTLDAIKLAEKTGCRRFVGAGSQAEFGPVEGIIDEKTPCSPNTAYGISKFAAGALSRKYCEIMGIEHVWGRVFSVYGPHDNEGTMIDYAIKCWKKGETARFSSGRQKWNYLYESDAGEMFYRLGGSSVSPGTWFVANPNSKVLREYIGIMKEKYGEGARIEFDEATGRNSVGLDVNMEFTIKEMGYSPKIEFEDGISKVINSHMK